VECFDNVVLFGLCHRMEEWKNEPVIGGEIRLWASRVPSALRDMEAHDVSP
jgi:hypothetical protein